MAKLGISTGTVPNDGMGDSLLDGAVKINSNFNEIYNHFGNGTVLTAIGGTWGVTTVGIHTLKNVGIGTTNPTSTLTVKGNADISGILTSSSAQISSLSGTNSNYSGVSTVGSLNIGANQVISSGRQLQNITSLDATTTATIESAIQSAPNDFSNLNVSGVSTLGNTVVGGATTQLIVNGDTRITGILTIGSSSITLNGLSNSIKVGSGVTIDGNAGIISATSIVVGGTTLTGAAVTSITAGSGISIDQSTGNVTITATGGGGSSQWVTTSAGIHTLSNVGIGTTNPTSALTVKGNTSLETLNVSGVSTFGVNLDIKGFGDDSIIEHTNASSGDLYLLSKRGTYIRTANGEASGYFRSNGAVELYYDNSKKFETLGAGVTVTGTTFTNQLSVSGVSTFTNGFVVPVNNGGTITGSPTSNSLAFTNNVAATFGNGANLSISNDGTTTNIWNSGPLVIRNNSLSGVTSITGNSVGTIADFTQDGEVRIPGKLQVGTGGTTITTSSGNVGIGTTNPTSKLTVRGGDISVGVSTAHGVILTSPNGTQYRLIVADNGTLSTVAV